MPGIPRELAEHSLKVDPKLKPIRQFLRHFNDERRKDIGEEIARLLAAGFIVEVFHPKWLANPVLVMKKNGTWRMCIDYTDLNKACPKDPFALPHIDQIIDSIAGCELLCFLEAYIFRISSDQDERRRPGKNLVHYTFWIFLLHFHAFWVKKRWSYISKMHSKLSQESDWT
jgi:hypothetical protein